MRARSLFALGLILATSCKRPEDQAARQRVFSPEQPQGVDAKARERLDARRLVEDAPLADRVLRMSRAEIATRLGAHKLAGKTKFTWRMGVSAPDAGPNEVTLAEESALVQAADGDFQATLQNDRNQGFEAVWSKGEIYVRSRFGPFRKRRTDRTDLQRLREQTSAGLMTFDQLARGLKLGLAGETQFEGRRALRYEVEGFGQPRSKPDESELPPVQWPTGGPDKDTSRRLSLWQQEQPVEVEGSIVIDAETASPLAWDLHGSFRVAAEKGGHPAELELTTSAKSSGLGRELAIKAPAFEPEPSVPHAVKDPLRFLGKQAPPAEGAPPAEESEEEEQQEQEEAAAPKG
jgi:hypothetical protein